jgi:hypothetical protein
LVFRGFEIQSDLYGEGVFLAIGEEGGGSRGAPWTRCREGGRGGCLDSQWERSDGGARIADVAGSEGRVFLLRGGGWEKRSGEAWWAG